MNHLLIVLHPPGDGDAAARALRDAEQALARGEGVRQVFFYAEGVRVLQRDPPPSARPAHERWRAFAQAHEVPILACSSAARRRLLVDDDGAPTSGAATSIARIGSLGQLMVAMADAGRVTTYAN